MKIRSNPAGVSALVVELPNPAPEGAMRPTMRQMSLFGPKSRMKISKLRTNPAKAKAPKAKKARKSRKRKGVQSSVFSLGAMGRPVGMRSNPASSLFARKGRKSRRNPAAKRRLRRAKPFGFRLNPADKNMLLNIGMGVGAFLVGSFVGGYAAKFHMESAKTEATKSELIAAYAAPLALAAGAWFLPTKIVPKQCKMPLAVGFAAAAVTPHIVKSLAKMPLLGKMFATIAQYERIALEDAAPAPTAMGGLYGCAGCGGMDGYTQSVGFNQSLEGYTRAISFQQDVDNGVSGAGFNQLTSDANLEGYTTDPVFPEQVSLGVYDDVSRDTFGGSYN